MLLDYYQKKLELPVYTKVSKGYKVGWRNPSTDSSVRRHTANAHIPTLLDSRLDILATCIGDATVMSQVDTS